MLHRFHCISLCHIVVLYRGSPDPLFHWCNFFMSDSRIWGSLAFRFGRFQLNPLTQAFSALLFKLTQFLCHKSVRNIGLLFVTTPFFQVRNAPKPVCRLGLHPGPRWKSFRHFAIHLSPFRYPLDGCVSISATTSPCFTSDLDPLPHFVNPGSALIMADIPRGPKQFSPRTVPYLNPGFFFF